MSRGTGAGFGSNRMAAKKIHTNDMTGSRGVNLIERVVLEMGYLWYPTGGVEAGIDGFIEIRDSSTGEVTNNVVQVQSKATTKAFTAETPTSFEYLCEERDLDYWLNGNAPVILVVSRPDSDEAYWAPVKDRFRDLEARKSRKVHFDKSRDRFHSSAAEAIKRLAVPRDSGLYLAPLPKHETLYTNLLGVSSYAPRIFIAETDFRWPSELWDTLRDLTDTPRGEWLLIDKSIVSFHDLREEPWRQVCERGTVESFDSDEFAFSEDDGRANTFATLLYLSLKERLWLEDVKFDRRFGHYYFRATNDLTAREISYQSLQNKTSRSVFTPYVNKKDPTKVKYYRHCAFEGLFRRFEEGWYLEITPTYRYTTDGSRIYRFYEDLLKGVKRLENNQAVLGQVVMWASILTKSADMFERQRVIEFGGLKALDLDAGLHDEAWLKHEDKQEPAEPEDVPEDKGQLTLFAP